MAYLSLDGVSHQFGTLCSLYDYIADKLDKENVNNTVIDALKDNVSDELKNNKVSGLSKHILSCASSSKDYNTPLEKIVNSFDPKKDYNKILINNLGIDITRYEELDQASLYIKQLKDDLNKSGQDKKKIADAFRHASKEMGHRVSEIECLLA